METNYSIDSLKKSAFNHELKNNLAHDTSVSKEARVIVQDYLNKRLKEIYTGLNEC